MASLSGLGPAPLPGRRRDSHQPAGREHTDGLHEVVYVRVVSGVVAAGAGGNPAAERGAGEALREVAQREAARPQLVFQRGAEHAALYAGRAGNVVYLQHAVESGHVYRHDAVVAPPAGVTPSTTDEPPP